MINRAYEVAEAGLWRAGYSRTHFEDTSKAVADDELALAYLDDSLVGAVQTRVMDVATGWFGALSVDPDLGGQGIGAALVSFVEQRAAKAGCDTMQLELLVPNPPHRHTQRLDDWYGRLGYREISRSDFLVVEPEVRPYLLRPCDVAVRQKKLPAASLDM